MVSTPVSSTHLIFKKADVIDPLPVIEGNPEELVNEIKNKPAKTHAASIMIVEDNMELRTFLLHTLSEDYNVSDVGTGQEALDFIKERQPDLILSDVTVSYTHLIRIPILLFYPLYSSLTT